MHCLVSYGAGTRPGELKCRGYDPIAGRGWGVPDPSMALPVPNMEPELKPIQRELPGWGLSQLLRPEEQSKSSQVTQLGELLLQI